MAEGSWTVLKLLQWTTRYFEQRRVSEPRASAEVLLAHVLSGDRLFLYLNYDRPLQANELARFKECIKRRLQGEPVQYITGWQEFWSLPFRVNPAVLVPRPETELLVETTLAHLRRAGPQEGALRILELGTGSGAVAIALARELPRANLVAADLSPAALRLARENAQRHEVAGRILFVCTDLFAGFSPRKAEFHAVVANPPYVSQAEFEGLPREIRDYEPRQALHGGSDGLAVTRPLIRQSAAYLAPKGAAILEIDASRAEAVAEMVRESGSYRNWRLLKDYSGMDRVLLAERP